MLSGTEPHVIEESVKHREEGKNTEEPVRRITWESADRQGGVSLQVCG